MASSGAWLGEGRFMMRVGWDDNLPHLPPEQIALQWKATPPYLRKARAYGIPVAGEHRIYPVEPTTLWYNPFRFPQEWPRAFALDPGYRMTAALWGALDTESDTWYLWTEYTRPASPPAVHSVAIRSRGGWIPGVLDPHYFGRADHADPAKMVEHYQRCGVNVVEAERTGVAAGIQEVYARMEDGRIRIARGMLPLLEFQIATYVMNEKTGKPDKARGHDDLVDCLRYLIMDGPAVALTRQQATSSRFGPPRDGWSVGGGDSLVGY